jgi:adenylate kinase family enzyme
MTKRYEKGNLETSIRMQVQFPDSVLQRILILGPSGSGKSTVCTRISRILGIPAVHLDMHFWNPNWVETPKEEWLDKVKNLTLAEKWVMDGNYTSTLQMRAAAADTIIFLEMSRRQSYLRVLTRYLRYRGKTRPDITEGCPEKIDMDFIRWIWNYPRVSKPRILKFMEKLKASKNVYFLQNQKEIEEFLKALRNRYGRDN